MLDTGQTLTNGDLKRIISIQVERSSVLEQLLCHFMKIKMTYFHNLIQNLSLEKPRKPRSGKIWGHSRTLSRVEALGMVRMVPNSLSVGFYTKR